MTHDSSQQVPLQLTRGMWIAIAVVMGIAWWGSRDARRPRGVDESRGFAFGSWTAPEIKPIEGARVELPDVGIAIEGATGFRFFELQPNDEDRTPRQLAFIHRASQVVGRIRPYDPLRDTWPPQPERFGDSLKAPIEALEGGAPGGAASETIDFGPGSEFRIQVQAMLYPHAEIVWAAPRRSPAWPLRVHFGKCVVGSQKLWLAVYELNATQPTVDYQDGPIGTLARALRPL